VKALSNVARLSALPSAQNPLLVFLGVKNDKKTALFLVSSQANPAGQGKCSPKPSHCELLALKLGQRESLLVVDANGSPAIYNLQVSAIRLTPTSSEDAARKANDRISAAGRKILRRASRESIELHSVSYSSSTGTVSEHSVPNAWLQHLMLVTGGVQTWPVLEPAGAGH
jgi:hypothetical protein